MIRRIAAVSALFLGVGCASTPTPKPKSSPAPTPEAHSLSGTPLHRPPLSDAVADEAYRACLATATNPDMQVATLHWLYMALRRMGEHDQANALLTPITADMEILENASYHRLLLMYKGETSEADLVAEVRAEGGIGNATLGYGIANWRAYNGHATEAQSLLAEILEGPQWAAFGSIAAEADLHRLATPQ